MTAPLERELAYRASQGLHPVPLHVMEARFRTLGYSLDRSMDCRSNARYMTGPRAGESYPSCSTGLREIDTGLSAFNADARRDANFRAMQALRSIVFAVTRDGHILEI